MSEAQPFRCAFDKAGDIRDHKSLPIREIDHTEIRI